jgi:DNA-directed RNA polymerase subunit beta'
MVCRAFNADFDGDQMAVHLPLSTMAQHEAKTRMLSATNLLKPATGAPICSLNQDIALGCYWLTDIWEGRKGQDKVFSSKEELILAESFGEVDIKARIKVKVKKEFVETSLGRLLFNEALPVDFPFQNKLIKIKDLEKIIAEIIEKYPPEAVEDTLDKIKNLGFEYSTLSGVTWGMDDLVIPPEKGKIVEAAEQEIEKIEEHYRKGFLSKEEKTNKAIEIWSRVKSEIEKLVPKSLSQRNPVFQMIEAGAKGSWGQPVQMAGMKGLVINPGGQIIELPVRSSFKEGFKVLEYFISTHGARKGTADTALRTSTAGYLTRRLVDVAHELIIKESDCHDKEGITIIKKNADAIGQNMTFKILGRIILQDIKGICKEGDIIDRQIAEKIIAAGIEEIRVRSPLSCKSTRGLCQKCYGWDLGDNKLVAVGEAVGIVAAQAIGEPGTQLTMRTFHTGGVAGGGDITMGLPRVQEIFEARTPAGKAEISEVDGEVLEVTQDKIIRIKAKIPPKTASGKVKTETVEYKIPARSAIWVEVGKEVKKGDQLCEGSLDLKELFKLVGPEGTRRYIVREIQRIYASQGALIHDKHIETICRQMFSRLKIKDGGDTIFTSGEIIERSKFIEENERVKKEKKQPAKGVAILLGISRVALTTDSFLSAASFQETSRVLIKSSLEGKEDELRGLKENVVIGKLIPAGTGLAWPTGHSDTSSPEKTVEKEKTEKTENVKINKSSDEEEKQKKPKKKGGKK